MRVPIFFILLSLLLNCGLNFCSPSEVAYCVEPEKNIVVNYQGREWAYSEKELGISANGRFGSSEPLLKKIKSMGFSEFQALQYVYPNLINKIEELAEEINVKAIDSEIDVRNGSPVIKKESVGRQLNEEKLLHDLFNKFVNGGEWIILDAVCTEIIPKVNETDLENLTNLKGSFTTYINGVNQEGRKNNIKEALSRINGQVILPNEQLSFNSVIGDTTRENGYHLAKVILNGRYEDDYGGGVCQASTTLYNAALIAGLEIVKVRPHSLKVGYIAGSFDSMVSYGISDLVIKNQTDKPVFIHAYSTEFECGVKIFGAPNDYEIKRRAEAVEFSQDEMPDISYKSEGFLDYYKDGVFIKSEKIRQDTYYKVKPYIEANNKITTN